MQTNDILWKGIIESLIEDFLTFFYPEEVHLFDFTKGITFLDQELAQLFPERGDDARIYKVLEQDEASLLQSTNPFAWVVLATLTALKKGKMEDSGIWQIKYNLVRLLYERNYPKEKIITLFTFINYYIRFANSENTAIFAKQILSTYEPNTRNMGIHEMILLEEKKEAKSIGIKEGIKEAKTEVILTIARKKPEWTAIQIAALLDMDEKEVEIILKSAK